MVVDMSNQPLLDHAAGTAQDARADLYLAFKRCASWRKVTQTNLHVRELLFWINAMDVERRGVAKSAAEVAGRLELKDGRAARYVIARAEEFGLLIVAAVLGDGVNYAIGARVGPRVFRSDTSRWFKREHLVKTQAFYERHGGKTIVVVAVTV